MTQRSFYTEKSLHKGDLHTEAFTRRHVYTQKVLQIEALTAHRNFYTEQPLHTQKLLYKKVFTKRSFYTQERLHKETLTQESFYTQKLSHTEGFYTEKS